MLTLSKLLKATSTANYEYYWIFSTNIGESTTPESLLSTIIKTRFSISSIGDNKFATCRASRVPGSGALDCPSAGSSNSRTSRFTWEWGCTSQQCFAVFNGPQQNGNAGLGRKWKLFDKVLRVKHSTRVDRPRDDMIPSVWNLTTHRIAYLLVYLLIRLLIIFVSKLKCALLMEF